MQINGRPIGSEHPPFIVAEVGANHGGRLDAALRLILLAKQAGADAVKFQAYEPDSMTIVSARPEFRLHEGPWRGRTLWELYRDCRTPMKWFAQLAEQARDVGITWFASVFDTAGVDALMKLDVPAFKIASFELVDLPLIRYVAQTGKPMILSTGMASVEEISQALDAAYTYANIDNVALLHCISGYPTPPHEANLGGLIELRRETDFDLPIGLSDHTAGIEIPVAATALGTAIIEKHFKLRYVRGPDTKFSLAPAEFTKMVTAVRNTYAALQPVHAVSEDSSKPLRRSLYVVKAMQAGELFSAANVRAIRPANGMAPRELENVLGKAAARDIAEGTPLHDELVG